MKLLGFKTLHQYGGDPTQAGFKQKKKDRFIASSFPNVIVKALSTLMQNGSPEKRSLLEKKWGLLQQ